MKQVSKIVQKEEMVTVCDVCRAENPDFCDIGWYMSCKYDGCTDDSGSYNFCSLKCFEDGIEQVKNDVAIDYFSGKPKDDLHNDTYSRRFTIELLNSAEKKDFTTIIHRFLEVEASNQ